MCSIYSLMDDLLVVEIVFPKNYFTLSPPLSLLLEAQHLTLRPRGFNKNPELQWVKQGRNSSIMALKTAREHLCSCVRKKMCFLCIRGGGHKHIRGECGCENEICLSSLTMYFERAHHILLLETVYVQSKLSDKHVSKFIQAQKYIIIDYCSKDWGLSNCWQILYCQALKKEQQYNHKK